MSSKFWWISTRASPDLPTGFIYQIHCGIYGPSKICHGCHESWVMSDDDISFKLFECMTSKSEHLRTSWTKLSMSSGRKPPTSRNFQRITKVNDLDHARKPTRGPAAEVHLMHLESQCWCLLFDAEEQPQQWHPKAARVEITQPWICEAGFFELLNLLEYLGPKGSEDISIYIVCAMFVLYPCHTRHKQRVISFHIGIPWLSILELINQGSFFSTSGAMYNKVPASSRDSLAD